MPASKARKLSQLMSEGGSLDTQIDSSGTSGEIGGGGGVSVYTSIENLPTSGNNDGDMALISSTNFLYMYKSSAWWNLAQISNTTISDISGADDAYFLSDIGTPTVLTLVSTDPDGFPLTWTYSESGIGNTATISQSDNVFTITPSTNEANKGDFTVTFNVTDGVYTKTKDVSFSLTFSINLADTNLITNYSRHGLRSQSTFLISDGSGTVFFKPDGTKMWHGGPSAQAIVEYSLSTPWDVSTVVQSSSIAAVTFGSDYGPETFAFKADGTRFYWSTDVDPSIIRSFDLTTAWSLEDLQKFDSANSPTSPALPANANINMNFSSDGTRLDYMNSATPDTLYSMELTTPWDITTLVPDKQYGLSSSSSNSYSVNIWNSDGSAWYIALRGTSSDWIYRYPVLTPYDISTTQTYSARYQLDANHFTAPMNIFWGGNYSTLIVFDSSKDTLNTLHLATEDDLSSVTLDTLKNIKLYSPSYDNLRLIKLNSDGTKMYLGNSGNAEIVEFELETAYDIRTFRRSADYGPYPIKSIDISANQGSNLTAWTWKPDLSTVWIYDTNNDRICKWSLSTPGDISTMTFVQIETSYDGTTGFLHPDSSILAEAGITGIQFSPDGTKFYMTGTAADKLWQWNLSTPWTLDFSVAADTVVSLTTAEGMSYTTMLARGIEFNSDGTRLFIGNYSMDGIYSYELTTGYDISTIVKSSGRFAKIGSFGMDPRIFSIGGSPIVYNSAGYQHGSSAYWQGWTFDSSGNNIYMIIDGNTIAPEVTGGLGSNSSIHKIPLDSPWVTSNMPDHYSFQFITSNPNSPINETNPTAFWTNDTGTKAFLVGATADTIVQMAMSTPYDIRTMSYDNASIVINASPYGFGSIEAACPSADGNYIFLVDVSSSNPTSTSHYIKRIDLGTPWDLSSATGKGSEIDLSHYGVTSTTGRIDDFNSSNVSGIDISPDGTKIYLVTNNRVSDTLGAISQFTLSTPFDLTTISNNADASIVPLTDLLMDNNNYDDCRGITFSNTGLQAFVAFSFSSMDFIKQWTLTTPYDLSTANPNPAQEIFAGMVVEDAIGTYDAIDNIINIRLAQNQSCFYITCSTADHVLQLNLPS